MFSTTRAGPKSLEAVPTNFRNVSTFESQSAFEPATALAVSTLTPPSEFGPGKRVGEITTPAPFQLPYSNVYETEPEICRQLVSDEIVRPDRPSSSQTSSEVRTPRSAAKPAVERPAAATEPRIRLLSFII